MESINPPANPMGMPLHSMNAPDSQPERHENLKYAVEVTSFARRRPHL